MAAPTVQHLEKRKPLQSDSTQLFIGTVPMDAVLLVGAGLFAAILCLGLAIWNVYVPSMSGSRAVREERARATTELRLKGGNMQHGGFASPPSSSRAIMEKRSHRSTGIDIISIDSESRILPVHNTIVGSRSGPRLAPLNGKRPSRASRGYSSHSKQEIAAFARESGSGSRPSLQSMLQLPTLPNDQSSPSLSSASGSMSGSTLPPSTPLHARPGPFNKANSMRASTTIGRGIDMRRNRSFWEGRHNVHVNPASVDPTYASNRHISTPGDQQDPLSGFELKRYSTEPSESREGSRRNSTINAIDYFRGTLGGAEKGGSGSGSGANSPSGYISRPYADNVSDHSSDGLAGSPARATPRGIPRTRPLALYDLEQDLGANQMEMGLLETRSPSPTRPRGGRPLFGR